MLFRLLIVIAIFVAYIFAGFVNHNVTRYDYFVGISRAVVLGIHGLFASSAMMTFAFPNGELGREGCVLVAALTPAVSLFFPFCLYGYLATVGIVCAVIWISWVLNIYYCHGGYEIVCALLTLAGVEEKCFTLFTFMWILVSRRIPRNLNKVCYEYSTGWDTKEEAIRESTTTGLDSLERALCELEIAVEGCASTAAYTAARSNVIKAARQAFYDGHRRLKECRHMASEIRMCRLVLPVLPHDSLVARWFSIGQKRHPMAPHELAQLNAYAHEIVEARVALEKLTHVLHGAVADVEAARNDFMTAINEMFSNAAVPITGKTYAQQTAVFRGKCQRTILVNGASRLTENSSLSRAGEIQSWGVAECFYESMHSKHLSQTYAKRESDWWHALSSPPKRNDKYHSLERTSLDNLFKTNSALANTTSVAATSTLASESQDRHKKKSLEALSVPVVDQQSLVEEQDVVSKDAEAEVLISFSASKIPKYSSVAATTHSDASALTKVGSTLEIPNVAQGSSFGPAVEILSLNTKATIDSAALISHPSNQDSSLGPDIPVLTSISAFEAGATASESLSSVFVPAVQSPACDAASVSQPCMVSSMDMNLAAPANQQLNQHMVPVGNTNANNSPMVDIMNTSLTREIDSWNSLKTNGSPTEVGVSNFFWSELSPFTTTNSMVDDGEIEEMEWESSAMESEEMEWESSVFEQSDEMEWESSDLVPDEMEWEPTVCKTAGSFTSSFHSAAAAASERSAAGTSFHAMKVQPQAGVAYRAPQPAAFPTTTPDGSPFRLPFNDSPWRHPRSCHLMQPSPSKSFKTPQASPGTGTKGAFKLPAAVRAFLSNSSVTPQSEPWRQSGFGNGSNTLLVSLCR